MYVSRKCVNVYIMYTNLSYELVLIGMKGKYGTCKVTTGNDVCACLYCVIKVITSYAHQFQAPYVMHA